MSAVGAAVLADPAVHGSPGPIWMAAVLAWLLAVPMWFVTQIVTTVAHEGGHAIIAKLLLRRLKGIRIKRSGDGVTELQEPAPWLFTILIALAGYLGPSMFGLLAAELLIRDAVAAVLWTSLVFLLLMLFAVRGLFGWLLVPALMLAIGWVATQAEPPVRLVLTHMWVWFLLIAPVEDVLVYLRRKLYTGGDARTLQALTRLPAELWTLFLLAGTIAALVYGGSLLLHHAS